MTAESVVPGGTAETPGEPIRSGSPDLREAAQSYSLTEERLTVDDWKALYLVMELFYAVTIRGWIISEPSKAAITAAHESFWQGHIELAPQQWETIMRNALRAGYAVDFGGVGEPGA